ncbi:MAG: antibiotic biosynthesis monooxygenase [Oscillospiraceae bacterium]|nr:antibiotic biosynthesis monooxygenase [Oscillospiraceae bacterium]
MYSIYVVYKTIPGHRADFIRELNESEVASAVRAEDGCIRYDYYLSEKDENEILLIEAWETKEHQQIHVTQPHIATLKALKEKHVVDTKLGEFELK